LKDLSLNTLGAASKAAKKLEETAVPSRGDGILDKIIGSPSNPASRYGQPQPDHVQQLNNLVKQLNPNTGNAVNAFKNLKVLQNPLGK
jgi:hypothetical protein